MVRGKDGFTFRENLEGLVRMGKAKPHHLAQLEGPELPEHLKYLWDWFGEIRMGADESMSGLRITWSALRAWSQFMGVVPEPRECSAIFRLDAVVRNPGDK